MFVDQLVTMQLDSKLYQPPDGIISQAHEKLVLKGAPVAPCDDLSATSYESCFHGFGWLLIVIPDDCGPISQSMERGGPSERSVRLAAATVNQRRSLGTNGLVT